MAEAFLQILLDNLTSLIQGEIGLIMGVNDEMKKLSSTLTTIQAVLQDAEDRQLQDRAVRDWLRKLNDLSYEIDDVLDECATEVARLEYQRGKSSVFNVKILKKLLYQHKFGRKIKSVTEKLDAVAAERTKFHLRETTLVLRSKYSVGRETGSVLNESHHVYGREEDKEKIVDILVNQVRDLDQLSILSIIGVGGLGKTTLAQLVYNDDRVIGHFDIKLWVCVSDNFDPKTLIKAMIESTTRSGSSSNLEHLDSLQHSLLAKLSQKRYLLVLDDVWNQDQDKWFALKDLLACGSPGSSIIVTTRLKKAVDIMSTVPAHHLKGLSEENCWLLFKQRAFGEEEAHTKLEEIGKQIVVKCAGVPLAAKALGGLLRFKRQEGDWLRVKESDIWNLPEEESSILPALRLSYHHLPFELRRCFAYCAVFPKDSLIRKKELIHQWIAHGYISSDRTLDVEDVGDEIINELVLRSLLQSVKRYSDSFFQMHDLVHDLAQSIMNNKVPGAQVAAEGRQISDNKIRQVDLLRSFVAFPTSVVLDMNLPTVIMRFSRLRSLDASHAGIVEVPSAIGSLKHVRFLNLSRNDFRTLPDTLCGLWNLKILNLNWCHKLVCLPKKMKRLRNLRHLFLERCKSLSQMPPKIGELSSLKTLSMFVASQGKHNQLGELQFMDLGDRICIEHLERVEDPEDANRANLREKQNLSELEFKWEKDESCKLDEVMDEKVLKALEPHANVKYLIIRGFRDKYFPCWMQSYSSMQNLTWLFLDNCPSCLSLPQVLGDLPHLKMLYLVNLGVEMEYIVEDEVQYSNSGRPKFPCVSSLHMSCLPHLKGLVKEARVVFPNLERLVVSHCPSFTLPRLSSLNFLSCSSIILPSFYKLDHLTTLILNFEDNMNCVPRDALENLTNLERLRILDADEHSLPDEGLQCLTSLRMFEIMDAKTLTCLPDRWLSHLTTLVDLWLHHCPELIEIPEGIKCLHNLKSLDLNGLPKMVFLPNSLQHLTSLQRLSLHDLSGLTSLPDWLGSLTALTYLKISYCPKLVSFPVSMQELKKLRSLYVIDCPELWKRCEKRNGEDWHKISHIPYISNRDYRD